MLDPRRQVSVAPGPVATGVAIARVPIQYRRTAVLTEDLRTKTDVGLAWVSIQDIVSLKAGARGYWAGRRRSRVQEIRPIWQRGDPLARSGDFADAWCFFGENRNGQPAQACVAVAPDRRFMLYFIGTRDLMSGKVIRAAYLNGFNFDFADPITNLAFEEGPAEPVADLHIEYSVLSWRPDRVRIGLNVQGYRAVELTLTPDSTGKAILRTPYGPLVITPSVDTPQTFQGSWGERTVDDSPLFNPATMSAQNRQVFGALIQDEARKATAAAQTLSTKSSPMVIYKSE
jgi:hypothetical protein